MFSIDDSLKGISKIIKRGDKLWASVDKMEKNGEIEANRNSKRHKKGHLKKKKKDKDNENIKGEKIQKILFEIINLAGNMDDLVELVTILDSKN